MAWTEEETIKLMELWGDDSVQEQLDNCVRNRNVYDKLSRQMEAAGFTRTAVQCREKNLKTPRRVQARERPQWPDWARHKKVEMF